MNMLRIAWKDIKFLLRSRTMLLFSILMPVLMMLMMGYIFPKDYSSSQMKIGVYCQDPLVLVMMRASKNEKTTIFKTREEMINALAKNEISAAVIVPKEFSKNLSKGGAKIQVLPNPSNPQAGVMMAKMAASMFTEGKAPSKSKKVEVELVGTHGEAFSYYDFMAPGMMAMIAIMSVASGLAASITRERELGTLDGLMVTPVSRASIVLGKIIAQTVRGVVQAFIVLGISIVLFGVKVHGNLMSTLLLLILSTFSFIGIGIIITAGIKQQETAQIVMTSVTFPMMFFSGVFFPIEQMPKIAQYISKFFPLTYAADALRKNITLGVGISFVKMDILILLIFALLTSTLATLMFPKLVKE